MSLSWTPADGEEDRGDFATFCCWNGSPATPWIQEVEDYVRQWVLSQAKHVLAFRGNDGDLVAVAAFDERKIFVPLVAPVENPGWHLLVIALRLEDQRKGLSSEVFGAVFEAMGEADAERVLCTAYVHKENQASIRACSQVGLDLLVPKDEHYWILLGEVPVRSEEA